MGYLKDVQSQKEFLKRKCWDKNTHTHSLLQLVEHHGAHQQRQSRVSFAAYEKRNKKKMKHPYRPVVYTLKIIHELSLKVAINQEFYFILVYRCKTFSPVAKNSYRERQKDCAQTLKCGGLR